MLPDSVVQKIIPILKKDAKRALKMKLEGFPRPYFCSFLLRDTDSFYTWAASGSTCEQNRDRKRNVYCDIRVGSYRYDQTSNGGLRDNDEEIESSQLTLVPIDDKQLDGLRMSLWRLSEARFREALSDYSIKEARRVSTVNESRKFASFANVKAIQSIRKDRPEKINEKKWVEFCRAASQWISELSGLVGNSVDFSSNQETKIFVSTENSIIVQHQQIFTLSASLRKLNRSGSYI